MSRNCVFGYYLNITRAPCHIYLHSRMLLNIDFCNSKFKTPHSALLMSCCNPGTVEAKLLTSSAYVKNL